MTHDEHDDATGPLLRLERITARVVLLVLLLGTGLIAVHRMLESDVFWHLHQGRAVLRHVARVVPEPTAFPELVARTPVAAWLWDATAFLVYDASGFAGLSALTLLCALLAAVAVLWMLRVTRPTAPVAAYLFVSAVALTCVTSRARARPEVAAMIMLPLLVGALGSFVRALWANDSDSRSRAAWRWGALAVATTLCWAQLHGSFLLALPIAAAFLGPALLDAWRDRRRRGAVLALGLAILLASLTSTSGVGLLSYGAEHAATDIRLHNAEMHPPIWGTFNPLRSTFGPLFPLLLSFALYGALGARRGSAPSVERAPRRRLGPVAAELGLVLIALAISTQSVRFLATATVLTAPLALHGASSLSASARGKWRVLALVFGCAAGLFAFQRAFDKQQRTIGPLGQVGLAEHAQPLAAAAWLKRAPAGTRVLSAYDAGGLLGLLLDGHARTYVDSRTMVLFDAVQFAVSRDVFRSRAVLERASQRHRAEVAVVPRGTPLCPQLGPPWRPVAVDPVWTTWSRREGDRPLSAVAPCGRDWLTPAACADDRRALRQDLAALRALRPSPLLGFVEASALQRCANDPKAALRVLPSRERAEGFLVARDVLEAELDLALDGGRRAVALLGEYAAQGDLSAWDVLQRAAAKGGVRADELLPVARAAVERFDDRAPPALRELLAMLCTEIGDAACAHFHGLRAALEGSPNAAALLSWLSTQHPDPKVRADAAAWREVVTSRVAGVPASEPSAGSVPEASPPDDVSDF